MTEWQDIATAPDHDKLLLWARADYSLWQNAVEGNPLFWDDPEVHVCSYSYIEEATGQRVFRSTQRGSDMGELKLWALFWLPLPEPPQQGEG